MNGVCNVKITRLTRIILFQDMSRRAQNSVQESVCVLSYRNRRNKYRAYILTKESCLCVEKKNQLDATDWFIALIIRLTCFGHFYSHHQELETICVLLPPMVCSAWFLVVGGQVKGSWLCVPENVFYTFNQQIYFII